MVQKLPKLKEFQQISLIATVPPKKQKLRPEFHFQIQYLQSLMATSAKLGDLPIVYLLNPFDVQTLQFLADLGKKLLQLSQSKPVDKTDLERSVETEGDILKFGEEAKTAVQLTKEKDSGVLGMIAGLGKLFK